MCVCVCSFHVGTRTAVCGDCINGHNEEAHMHAMLGEQTAYCTACRRQRPPAQLKSHGFGTI